MTRDELEAALAIALPAARDAAAFVRAGFRTKHAIEHKGVVDLVTDFDRASEAMLRERLAALPYAFVGEEAGGTRDDDATLFVDPIDGTTNFVHGHPFWCVSIGLVVRGEPVLGVVVAPVLGLELYGWVADGGERHATRRSAGDRAWLDEQARVSDVARFEDALLATGFPHDRKTSPDNNFAAFAAIKRTCQAVRRCGSAALDLCLVADGTYEGYWEKKLRPWDIAGGTAIVRAAGGRVTDFDGGGSFIASGHCVATNGLIHDVLLGELAKVRPPGDVVG
jgi:myo-inositol-1(or 4)-monophosphatase